jgi:outer membrane protein OmpA-like peptidoglycan-associated protein
MKKIILICVTACFACAAFSQQQENLSKEQNRHEFFAGVGGGISTLLEDLSAGKRQTEFSYQAGLGYTYFFNYNWGLSIGGEFSFLSAGAKIDRLTDQSLVWSPGFDYYHVESQYITEKQDFFHVNIPLMARFQIDLPVQSMKFYVAAGPKIGIPVKNSYHTEGTLATWGGNFPDQSNYTRDPFENMPNHGFYDSYPVNYEGEFKKQIYFSGAFETGIKYSINSQFGLYAGLFADFGLNNLIDRSEKDLQGNAVYPDFIGYNYTDPTRPVINSIMTAAYGHVTPENGGIKHETPFVNRVNTVSAGLKIGITFGQDPVRKKEALKKEPEPQAPYEGLTEAQMQKMLTDKTNDLIRAQQKEFQDLKDFLAREEERPDLSATVYCFDFDKDNIPGNMKEILDNKVQRMKEYPRVNLVLEGHTDQAGSDRYNVELGMKRAEAVKSYMMSKGIESNRLKVTSKGKSVPIESGSDEQARCRNRRVEFIIDCSF